MEEILHMFQCQSGAANLKLINGPSSAGNGTYGEIRHFKKTGSNIDERIAGRRSAQQRGNEQKWKMDCENK